MELATTDVAANFRTLSMQVRAAGLLGRRTTYYWVKIALTIAGLVGAWAGLVAIGNTWSALGIAALLGALFTQLGFLGHDAGHQQIFASRRANRLLGLTVGNLLIGLSYGWWVPKHCSHHAHPNEPGRDPDVGEGQLHLPGIGAILDRWQAPLFFPLMLLRSVGLHISGVQQLLRRRDRAAIVEAGLLTLHAALYLSIVFLVLSPVKALAFILVQQAVFSVYLGCSFAPNHKAMPLLEPGVKLGFAQRQVITARNVTGGGALTFAIGGLNYQIEHHLFPSMARPNLRHAQFLVKQFCQQSELDYCEVGLLGSFRDIVSHLRLQERQRVSSDVALETAGP